MAIRQSTQTGNTHSAPFAFGSAVVDGDQLQVTSSAHAITFDQNCVLGISLCTVQQGRPTVSAVGSGGGLPAGAYRIKIAAVGSTGTTTVSAQSLTLTITAGQLPRVTLPALPAGASSWNVYLCENGGGIGTERRYASGQPAGSFDCVSALWENGTVAYASASGLPPMGDAFGYSTPTTHTAGVVINAGILVTSRGDFSILGELRLNAGAILEFDAAASPGGDSIYRLFFGTTLAAGTPKLTMRGSSGAFAIVRSKVATTPAFLRAGSQTSVSGDVRLDLEWARFSLLGDLTNPSINAKCAVAYNQLLTDVIIDPTCSTPDFNAAPGGGGWSMLRVAFRTPYSLGHVQGSRRTSAMFRATNNKTTGLRSCVQCSFETLPPATQGGGAIWDNCYLDDGWANVSSGGGITTSSELRDCFVRKMMPDVTNATDTVSDSFDDFDNYLYVDQATGGGVDLNPHGLGMPASGGASVKRHENWTIEYNGAGGSGDMFKSPSNSGTVQIVGALIIPNAGGTSSGNIFTFPHNPDPGYRLEIWRCTFVGNNNGLNTSEGGAQPAGTVALFKSNLIFSVNGTGSNRFAMSKASGDGENDTLDIAAPSDVSHNTVFNLDDVTGDYVGAYSWYRTRFSSAPGAFDINLGNNPGADLSLFGPKFVAPTRNFLTWCETVLGATGTTVAKITAGLDALRAIADVNSPDHVIGLTNKAPATWVRAGFVPQAALLDPSVSGQESHDGLFTRGAIEGAFGGPPPPPPSGDYVVVMGGRLGVSQSVW